MQHSATILIVPSQDAEHARDCGVYAGCAGRSSLNITRRVTTITERKAGIALLAFILCSSFQFFHSFGKAFETQPLAPPLLFEATLSVLILLATASILTQAARGRVRQLDLFFFLFPVCWLALSSLFAWLNYNQPLIYGISEDRRVLTFLYWFALDPVRRRFGLTVSDILIALVICATVYLVVALGIQLLLPDRLNARAIPDLDVRRLRMSAPSDCFAITFLAGLAGLLMSQRRGLNLAAVAIGLVGLLQVAQTRQVTIAVLGAALLLVWLWRPRLVLLAGSAGAVAFLAVVQSRGSVVFEQLIEAVLPNMSEFAGANLAENARMQTLGIVTRLLADHHLFGLGAVSLLYDGGLARLYGRNFFINDVGMAGEVFRVGFFYLGFACAYAAMVMRLWQRIPLTRHRVLVGGILLFYLMLAATDGFFYRLGYVHAFILLLMAAAAAPASDELAEPRQAAPRASFAALRSS